MKKQIVIDERAEKELRKFSLDVQRELKGCRKKVERI